MAEKQWIRERDGWAQQSEPNLSLMLVLVEVAFCSFSNAVLHVNGCSNFGFGDDTAAV